MNWLVDFSNQTKEFDKFFIGFDQQFDRLAKMHDDLAKNIPNYPPCNVRKLDDCKYVIELAVAGFAKSDIEITLEGNKIIIKGKTNEEDGTFLWKGIANRAFTRTFAIDDQIEIKDAAILNGMLKIALERIIPEHKKPRKIELKSEEDIVTTKTEKKFLTEEQTS